MTQCFGNSFQHSPDSLNIPATPTKNSTSIIIAKGDSNPDLRPYLRKLRIDTQTFWILQERLKQKVR
jgi:hypothetical protein